MNKCEHCGETYFPRQRNQRFCGSVCAIAWHQDERRRGIELLRNARLGPVLPEPSNEDAQEPASKCCGGEAR